MAKTSSKKPAKKAASNQLTAPEFFALLRASEKHCKQLRDELPVGMTENVDVTVRIRATLSVAPPQQRSELVRPDPTELLTLVLANLSTNVQTAILKKLDATYGDLEDGERPSGPPEIRQMAELSVNKWTRREAKEQRGAVSAIITATEVIARG